MAKHNAPTQDDGLSYLTLFTDYQVVGGIIVVPKTTNDHNAPLVATQDTCVSDGSTEDSSVSDGDTQDKDESDGLTQDESVTDKSAENKNESDEKAENDSTSDGLLTQDKNASSNIGDKLADSDTDSLANKYEGGDDDDDVIYKRAKSCGVALEDMKMATDGSAVNGTIIVCNECYAKDVGVCHSTDLWQSYDNTPAQWVETVKEGILTVSSSAYKFPLMQASVWKWHFTSISTGTTTTAAITLFHMFQYFNFFNTVVVRPAQTANFVRFTYCVRAFYGRVFT